MSHRPTAMSSQPAASRAGRGYMLPHTVHRDFLPDDTVAALLEYAVAHETDFVPTEVRSQRRDPTVRLSARLAQLGAFRPIIEHKIFALLPTLTDELHVAPFQVDTLEIELVAHGDGAFYKRHIDTRMAPVGEVGRSRVLSAVYYFFTDPKAFSGGALRLHGIGDRPDFVDIEPVRNSLVVFPSWAPHEVMPVRCPSRRFVDSRFAINCWIYRTLGAANA